MLAGLMDFPGIIMLFLQRADWSASTDFILIHISTINDQGTGKK